ncbi:hypothetical protein CRG98_014978 [Punica granatum]|uniref:Uncharacterized protein n=1 Tax=Punica granatum TaxID=22663 RepID=A0A2I0K8X4_PUNGR|nr:hypothetical protein CRG98_014978 [Punica granatum]
MFLVCPGLGTFGTVHERLGPSLRSPRSPILYRAVVGVTVPTSFSLSCRYRCSRVSIARHVQPGHPPLPRLFPSYIKARHDRNRRGRLPITQVGSRRALGPTLGGVAESSLPFPGLGWSPSSFRSHPLELIVYLVPLDPGDSTALDLRVVNSKWRLLLTCVPGKVDTPKLRCIGSAHACPDEMKFGCAQLGDSTGDL